MNQYELDGTFIKQWDSKLTASKELGIGEKNIQHCAAGKQHSAGGFIWRYEGSNIPVKPVGTRGENIRKALTGKKQNRKK